MVKTQSLTIGILAASVALSFSGQALAVNCLSENKKSAEECQARVDSNSAAPLDETSFGVRLDAGKQYVLFHNNSVPTPKFVTNDSQQNIFVPQKFNSTLGYSPDFNAFYSNPPAHVTFSDAIVPGRYTLTPVNVCGLKGLHVLNPSTLKEPAAPLPVPNAGHANPPAVQSLFDSNVYVPLLPKPYASSTTFDGTEEITVVYKADNRPGYYYKELQTIQFGPGKDSAGNYKACWGGTTMTAGAKINLACDATPPQIAVDIGDFYYKYGASGTWKVVQNVHCPEDGICGSADGTVVTTQPTGIALCTAGTVSGLKLNGTSYTWNCDGTNNGTGKACSTIGTAACNAALSSDDFTAGTPSLCSTGSGSTVTTSIDAKTGVKTWSWTCTSGSTSAKCDVTAAPTCESCIGKEGTFGFSCPTTPTCNDEAVGKVYDIYAASGASSTYTGAGEYASISMSMIKASTRIANITSYASTLNFPFFTLGYYDSVYTLQNYGTWVNGVLVGKATDRAIIPGFASKFTGGSTNLGYHQATENTDWFGICWDGSWSAPADGWYTFVTLVDDAVAMYIDGTLIGQDTDGFVPGKTSCARGAAPDGSYWATSLYTYKNPYANAQQYVDLPVDSYLTSLGQTLPSCLANFKGGNPPYATAFKPVYLTKGTHEVEVQYINGWATGIGLQAWVLSGSSYAPGDKVPSSALPSSAHMVLGPPVANPKKVCP